MKLDIALNSTNTVVINLNENENFYLVATLLSVPICKAETNTQGLTEAEFFLGSLEENPASPRKPQWWKAAQSLTEGKQASAEPNPACP